MAINKIKMLLLFFVSNIFLNVVDVVTDFTVVFGLFNVNEEYFSSGFGKHRRLIRITFM